MGRRLNEERKRERRLKKNKHSREGGKLKEEGESKNITEGGRLREEREKGGNWCFLFSWYINSCLAQDIVYVERWVAELMNSEWAYNSTEQQEYTCNSNIVMLTGMFEHWDGRMDGFMQEAQNSPTHVVNITSEIVL